MRTLRAASLPRNPSARSASDAPSLGALAATVPVFAHPAMPIPYAYDAETVYVHPEVTPAQLAAALWCFLRDVGGFSGDHEAELLPVAERRLPAVRRAS